MGNSNVSENDTQIPDNNPYPTKYLYVTKLPHQLPVFFSPDYNVSFLGLERLHPFDSRKWQNIYKILKKEGLLNDQTVLRPLEANEAALLLVHSKEYLNSLKWSWRVAAIAEIPPLAVVPNVFVQKAYLKPMRFQTGGTIAAARQALDCGWAINIGGGFHHCSSTRGGGFCAYADITLAIRSLFQTEKTVQKAMIVDLDAHQGNGYARDFLGDDRVYIMDVYNASIYPRDQRAKGAIRQKVELAVGTETYYYLTTVESKLIDSLNEFHPDIIVYNAGTDILQGDPLGLLNITEEGIINRDELVFQQAADRGIPIIMVTSGGYLRRTAKIIAKSIINLSSKRLLPGTESHQRS